MKKLMVLLAVVALIAGLGIMRVEAAPSSDISVTVTLQNISVTVSPTAWPIGAIAAGATSTLTTASALNNGNVIEDLAISCDNSDYWASVTTISLINQFIMGYCAHGNGTYPPIGSASQPLTTNLGTGVSYAFDLQFTAPQAGSNATEQQTIPVTVTASLYTP